LAFIFPLCCVVHHQIYTVHVRENLPVDSVITTVVAHDDDSSKFGNIRYGVAERGNTNMGRNLVRIDPTSGRVLLNSPLNHARHNKYVEEVIKPYRFV